MSILLRWRKMIKFALMAILPDFRGFTVKSECKPPQPPNFVLSVPVQEWPSG